MYDACVARVERVTNNLKQYLETLCPHFQQPIDHPDRRKVRIIIARYRFALYNTSSALTLVKHQQPQHNIDSQTLNETFSVIYYTQEYHIQDIP